MNIKKVERIREEYRERALDKDNPDREIRNIWNTAVYISSCYTLFKSNPIKNMKHVGSMFKKMRELEKLVEGK